MSGDHADGHQDAHAPISHLDGDLPVWERRAGAIQELLAEKGIISNDEIRAAIDEWESRSPALGARVVARAWTDPAFKARLLDEGTRTLAEFLELDMGLPEIAVLENTDRVHHVVVCTLCSCYPRAILGMPPAWYKSLAYRSRVIVEPRVVLREFGLELPPDVEVRVVDSTADVRYLVLPRRPSGTDGLTEDALAALVTRDSLIGVAEAREPVPA